MTDGYLLLTYGEVETHAIHIKEVKAMHGEIKAPLPHESVN